MKAASVPLLTGDGRAAGVGEAWVPSLEEVGGGESVGEGIVGEERGRVIDEKAERVGHAWEGEGAERRGEKEGGGEALRVNMSRTHGSRVPRSKSSHGARIHGKTRWTTKHIIKFTLSPSSNLITLTVPLATPTSFPAPTVILYA